MAGLLQGVPRDPGFDESRRADPDVRVEIGQRNFEKRRGTASPTRLEW